MSEVRDRVATLKVVVTECGHRLLGKRRQHVERVVGERLSGGLLRVDTLAVVQGAIGEPSWCS